MSKARMISKNCCKTQVEYIGYYVGSPYAWALHRFLDVRVSQSGLRFCGSARELLTGSKLACWWTSAAALSTFPGRDPRTRTSVLASRFALQKKRPSLDSRRGKSVWSIGVCHGTDRCASLVLMCIGTTSISKALVRQERVSPDAASGSSRRASRSYVWYDRLLIRHGVFKSNGCDYSCFC